MIKLVFQNSKMGVFLFLFIVVLSQLAIKMEETNKNKR